MPSWRQFTALVALSATALPPLIVASSVPRGVDPAHANLYASSSTTWSCLDGSGPPLPLSAINDDYCDCPDGSDEPGTSACASLALKSFNASSTSKRPPGFWCENKGHIPSYILPSRVNDGICDPECCDGSDEYDDASAKSPCPNVCAKVGKEHRKRLAEQANIRRAGSKVRDSYIAQTRRKMAEAEAEIARLEVEVQVAKEVEERRREELRRAEQVDEAVAEEKRGSPLYAAIREHQEAMRTLAMREGALREELEKLTSLLDDLSTGYNPNYQDMAVKGAVMAYRAWRKGDGGGPDVGEEEEANAAGDSKDSSAAPIGENVRLQALLDQGEWTTRRVEDLANKEALDLLDDSMFSSAGSDAGDDEDNLLFRLREYLPDQLTTLLDSTLDSFLSLLIKTHLIPRSALPKRSRRRRLSTPSSGGSDDAEPASVTAARSLLNEASSRLNQLENDLAHRQEDVVVDPAKWGPQSEWRALQDVCIEKDMGEYTYELCFFGQATQKPNRGHGGNVSLGRFSRFEPAAAAPAGGVGGLDPQRDAAYFSRQVFDQGQRCWNGPERSAIVYAECGAKNELLDVFEAEKCIYEAKVRTPALCWAEGEVNGAAAAAGAAANGGQQEEEVVVEGAKDEL